MIVLQLVAMVTKAEEWDVIKRIDKRTIEHSVVLASHSTQLEAILGVGLSPEFTNAMKEKINAKTR